MNRDMLMIVLLLVSLGLVGGGLCAMSGYAQEKPAEKTEEPKGDSEPAKASQEKDDEIARLKAGLTALEKENSALKSAYLQSKPNNKPGIHQLQDLMAKLTPMVDSPKEAWSIGAHEYSNKRLVHAISYGVLLLLALSGLAGGTYGGKEAVALAKKDNETNGARKEMTGPEFLVFTCGVIVAASVVMTPIFAGYGISALGDYMAPDLAFVEYLTDLLQDAKLLQ